MRNGSSAAAGGPEDHARRSTSDGRSATGTASGAGRDWIAALSTGEGRETEPSHPQHGGATTAESAAGRQQDAESIAAGAKSAATISVAKAIRAIGGRIASLSPRQSPVRPQMAERLGESSQTLGERRGVEVGVGV